MIDAEKNERLRNEIVKVIRNWLFAHGISTLYDTPNAFADQIMAALERTEASAD